jgi:AraC family chemosensory pili system transcriptional regulator ChpD
VSVYLSPAAVASWTGGHPVDVARPSVHAPGLRAALLTAARTGADPEQALAERMSVLFLALVDRTGTRTAPAPGPRDPRVRAVLDRLRGDLTAPVRLDDLATDVGLSREHLIRCFTRATGCPPYAWHLQARLAEGRRLLRRGDPVAEVVHRLGFADQAHFSRHFRAAHGTTPGRYRTPVGSTPSGVNI